MYLDNDVRFEADNLPPDISAPPEFDVTDVGLGVVAEFDTRDDTLSPSRDFDLKAAGMFMGSWLGGDNDYQNYSLAAKSYFAVHPRLVLAARAQGGAIAGAPPFYARPYVLMRGIPRLRYWCGQARGPGTPRAQHSPSRNLQAPRRSRGTA